MTLTLGMVTCDTADAEGLGRWWAEQVGGTAARVDQDDDSFVVVSGGPVLLAFQQVADPTPGKNRLHLDLSATDLDAEVERLVAAGASLVERRGGEAFAWVTLTDPAGNEFCVASHDAAEGEYS